MRYSIYKQQKYKIWLQDIKIAMEYNKCNILKTHQPNMSCHTGKCDRCKFPFIFPTFTWSVVKVNYHISEVKFCTLNSLMLLSNRKQLFVDEPITSHTNPFSNLHSYIFNLCILSACILQSIPCLDFLFPK